MTQNVVSDRLPLLIEDEQTLDDVLTRPTPELVEAVSRIVGDVAILGVGGKMGPTLAILLRRAIEEAGTRTQVIGVSRFTRGQLRTQIEEAGVHTISCDLLDPDQLAILPHAQSVIYMVGMKFGSTEQAELTWAMNTYLPGMVTRHFAGARIVALSTGNVYPLMPVRHGGCRETGLVGPVGEYAQSCLGRERIFSYWSQKTASPLALVRLNYAVELRYGVVLDVARQVYDRQPVDLAMGSFNCIWQGDACSAIIRALDLADICPAIMNLTGPETVSVRRLAERFGRLFGVEPTFASEEQETALLSDASQCHARFGYPRVPLDQIVEWTAHWVRTGGATLDKPTHFQARDGRF